MGYIFPWFSNLGSVNSSSHVSAISLSNTLFHSAPPIHLQYQGKKPDSSRQDGGGSGYISYLPNDRLSTSHPSSTCRCIEMIIAQLTSLLVLFHDEGCAFDTKPVQIQGAVNTCRCFMACSCAGKGCISTLSISMLIPRIIAILERVGGITSSPKSCGNP